MSKRKFKIEKKRQLKASSHQNKKQTINRPMSSFGGVPLLNNGGSSSNRIPTTTPPIIRMSKQMLMSNSTTREIVRKRLGKNKNRNKTFDTDNIFIKKSLSNNEQNEFYQEYLSMKERMHVQAICNPKRRQKQSCSQPLQFQPATLRLDKKSCPSSTATSTQHLVDTTTQLIANGMKDIGGCSAQIFCNPQQSLENLNFTANLHILQKGNKNDNNRYAILRNDDSDDEDDINTSEKKQPLFVFAPPTFSFSSCPVAYSNPISQKAGIDNKTLQILRDEAFIDPDL